MTRRGRPGPSARTRDLAACSVHVDLYLVFGPALEVLVASQLTYLRSDPFAVRLVCHADLADPVTWYLSRNTLTVGLWAPAGQGDVTVRPGTGPERGSILIGLRTTDGAVELRGCAWELREFLEQTERVVPLGAEHRHVDLDALIRQLTQDG
ncbi:SsgA family sporulation/cell division regulator [Streptomyces tateyamensis]|uniref:SsgA family sporulation/cell division regulator n=1 Tax=Streptomyces tateyamensis TaxID=565073 RepID=UPI0015E8A927|nr:SsgA family sporulation/cell division regulator [Streptomyces tateyamensis]